MADVATVAREDLESAWKRLAEHARPTTFIQSESLNEVFGAQITLACEMFQLTGSFKFRGAFNLLSTVPNRQIVSASSGNFGQAVALAAGLLGKECTVVMPDTSSKVKIEAVRRNGATVELVDTTKISRMDRVRELMAEKSDAFYAPAYDEVRVVAGNSSLGREIFERGIDLDAVIVPVGGGGLISGIVTARDVLGAHVPIFGAEPAIANDAARSFHSGALIANELEPPTMADGARTLSLGQITWPIVCDGLEDIIEVPEAAIAEGMRQLFRFANVKAEPTGALSVGALSQRSFAGQRICCVVSGGNVDEELYAAVLRREL